MSEKLKVLAAVRSALASQPRIGPRATLIAMDLADGTLTLDGEVGDVASKKLALEQAVALPGVVGIVDRLRVMPAQVMGDGQIRDLLRRALLQEPALAELTIQEMVKGKKEIAREPSERQRGWICLSVAKGVVTLDGEVPNLAQKRLAGVLAWWVPGSRDVINGLGLAPGETDNDDEIVDAVRLVLEKDPFVNSSQIHIASQDAVVTLDGLVAGEPQREMAECDAWYVFGVDQVINRIGIDPIPPGRGAP